MKYLIALFVLLLISGCYLLAEKYGSVQQWRGGALMSRRGKLSILFFIIGLALAIVLDTGWPILIILPAWLVGWKSQSDDTRQHQLGIERQREANVQRFPQLAEEVILIDRVEDLPAVASFELFDDNTGEYAGCVTRQQLSCYLNWYAQLIDASRGTIEESMNRCYLLEEEIEMMREDGVDEELLEVLTNATAGSHDALIRWVPKP